jgi:hypothetical protein
MNDAHRSSDVALSPRQPTMELLITQDDPLDRSTTNRATAAHLYQSTMVNNDKRTLSNVMPMNATRRNPSEMPSQPWPHGEVDLEDFDSESSLSEELFRDYDCFSEDEDVMILPDRNASDFRSHAQSINSELPPDGQMLMASQGKSIKMSES